MRAAYRIKLTARFVDEAPALFADKITTGDAAVEAAKTFWDQEDLPTIERVYALYLNTSNKPVAWAEISVGGITQAHICTKKILSHGLLANASSFIVYHNHPSGSLNPSSADRKATREIRKAAQAVGMILLDHIIVTPSWEWSSVE